MKKIILILAALLLAAGVARAATTANSLVTAQTPNRGIVQFLQGTDSANTYKTLYTAGTNGSACFGMWATNSEAATAHLVTVQVINSTVKYGGTAVTIPFGAGFATGVPPVALMSASNWPGLAVDGNVNPYILLISGDTLSATFASAFVTASSTVNIVVTCMDY